MLSGRGLCDELITRPEESYRLCCVIVCDLETSRIGAPYIYDISSLRVNLNFHAYSLHLTETVLHTLCFQNKNSGVCLRLVRKAQASVSLACNAWTQKYRTTCNDSSISTLNIRVTKHLTQRLSTCYNSHHLSVGAQQYNSDSFRCCITVMYSLLSLLSKN